MQLGQWLFWLCELHPSATVDGQRTEQHKLRALEPVVVEAARRLHESDRLEFLCCHRWYFLFVTSTTSGATSLRRWHLDLLVALLALDPPTQL